MKHTTDRKRKFSAAALAAAGLVCAAFLWSSCQSSSFDPSGQEAGALKNNEVVFPDEEKFSPEESGETGDSDVWEQDSGADNQLRPEDQPDSGLLFETDMPGEEFREALSGVDLSGLLGPSFGTEGGIVVTASGGTAPAEPIPGTGAGSGETAPGHPEPPSVEEGQRPDGQKPGGSSGGVLPGENGGSGSGGENGEPVPDPGETIPDPPAEPMTPVEDLPEDPLEWMYPDQPIFPAEGAETEQSGYSYLLNVESLSLEDGVLESFYIGEEPTLEKFFRAMYFRVFAYSEGSSPGEAVPDQIYRLNSFGDNFRVSGIPERVEGPFDVSFYFRPDDRSDWQKVTVTCQPVACAVVLHCADENGSPCIRQFYLQPGEQLDLSAYYAPMVPYDIWEDLDWTTFELHPKWIFPGWVEVFGDEQPDLSAPVVPPLYVPDHTGRIELWPREAIPCPEGWELTLDRTEGLQTVSRLPSGTGMVWEVPEGIASICLTESAYGDRLILPASVRELSRAGCDLYVERAYEADAQNPYLYTENGVLFTRDGTGIPGVPASLTGLTIPETVTWVSLPFAANGISCTLTFLPGLPPEVTHLDSLYNARIVVPAASGSAYYARFCRDLGDSNHLYALKEDPEHPGAYIETEILYQKQGNLVLSPDGGTLVYIQPEAGRALRLPEGIEVIASGALLDCTELETLALPRSIRMLESGSLSGESLLRVLFLSSEPPEMAEDALPGAARTYCLHADADPGRWLEVLPGAEAAEYISDEDGWRYLLTESGCILFRAPMDLACFDERSLPDVTLTEIASEAFRDCSQLVWASFPETTTVIGRDVFLNCLSLEGIFFGAEEELLIGSGTIPDDGSDVLRFVAGNAMSCLFEEGELSLYFRAPFFAPTGSVGYPSCAEAWSASYELEALGDGRILYAVSGSCDLGGDGLEYGPMVLAATSDIEGELVLRPDTLVIREHAFEGCSGLSSVHAESMGSLRVIQGYAFADCGLEGALNLPDSLYELAGSAFCQCASITSLYLPGDHLGYADTVGIGSYCFQGCSSLSEVVFGENCTIRFIGEGAFDGTALEEVVLPDTVKFLGMYPFGGCSGMTLTFTSAVPPSLTLWAPGMAYCFTGDEDLTIRLAGEAAGQEVLYEESWYRTYGGYPDPDGEERLRADVENDIIFNGDYFLWWMEYGEEEANRLLSEESERVFRLKLISFRNSLRVLMQLEELPVPPELLIPVQPEQGDGSKEEKL